MFRVTFAVEDKKYEVLARVVDTTSHPFLIYISDLEFEDRTSLIISPNGDEARKRFGDVGQVAIPVSGLRLLEEIPDCNERITSLKVAANEKNS